MTTRRRGWSRARLTGGTRLGTRLRQFSLSKDLGAPIDFVWPCTNGGTADGVAFIKVLESGMVLWDSPPFTIPKGATVATNLHQTVDLSLGVHPLVPQLWEGFPPGERLIEGDTLALTVVSNPLLSAVGLPLINNLPAPTSFLVRRGSVIPISWPCQNSGGGSGLARLKIRGESVSFTGTLITIPGFSTVVLLANVTAFEFAGVTRTQTVTMEDSLGRVLGSWTYSFTTTA